jgi:hypothetical protein
VFISPRRKDLCKLALNFSTPNKTKQKSYKKGEKKKEKKKNIVESHMAEPRVERGHSGSYNHDATLGASVYRAPPWLPSLFLPRIVNMEGFEGEPNRRYEMIVGHCYREMDALLTRCMHASSVGL